MRNSHLMHPVNGNFAPSRIWANASLRAVGDLIRIAAEMELS